MCHSRWIGCILFLSLFGPLNASAAGKQKSNTDTNQLTFAPDPKPFKADYFTVSLTFLSWNENSTVTNAGHTGGGKTVLFGNSVMFEQEHYFDPKMGMNLQGSALFGLADSSGTAGSSSYHVSEINWWGVSASPRFAYRLSRSIIFTGGPLLVYRSLSLPQDSAGSTSKTGSSLNIGATANLRIRLFSDLELHEELGNLFLRAATFWSLGLGYMF